MSSQDGAHRLDAVIGRVLERHELSDQLTFGSIMIDGYFERRYVELGDGDERVSGWVQTFDCRAEDVPPGLSQGEEVEVAGEGTLLYQRTEPNGTGRVLLYLGSTL